MGYVLDYYGNRTDNTIGARIYNLRMFNNLSLRQLGKELKVSDRAISHWEYGRREPSAYCVIALSEYFGVTCDYILKGGKMNE